MSAKTITRWLRDAPVTAWCLAICLAMFLVTTAPRQTVRQRLQLLDRWGAVIERTCHSADDPQTAYCRGPVALWQGEWWRIPWSAFHHIDVLHLLSNSVAAAYLGWFLERFWGSRRMLEFVLAASCLSLVPEFLLGHCTVGFSGVACAMFGALCVLRHHDERLAEAFPEELLFLGGALLALGVLFTALEISVVANLAHLAGFFYGAGFAYFRVDRSANKYLLSDWLLRIVTAVAVGAAWWFVLHPDWNGTYHFFLAVNARDADQRLAELRQSVDRKPRDNRAWQSLAGEELRGGDKFAAWQTLLRGLSFNPTDAELMKLARRNWRELVISPGRADAERAIRDVFGETAIAWETEFRRNQFELPQPGYDWFSSLAEAVAVVQFPLDQAVDLRLPDVDATPFQFPPEGDAVEGRRM